MKKQGTRSGPKAVTVKKTATANGPSLKSQRRPTDTAVKKKIEKALKRLHPMD